MNKKEINGKKKLLKHQKKIKDIMQFHNLNEEDLSKHVLKLETIKKTNEIGHIIDHKLTYNKLSQRINFYMKFIFTKSFL